MSFVTVDRDNVIHAYPLGDLVEHQVEDISSCVCGASIEVDRDSGGVVVLHHSLDGREQREHDG